ncbi:MAG: spheroidene monooxygenase [Cyclobacteriaceae bacterium]
MDQVTTITFCRYKSLFHKIWAFFMMQFAHGYLKDVEGMTFYKLMGSGKGLGFNPLPDWSVYVLIQVWENHKAARLFIDSSELMQKYRARSTECMTVFMRCVTTHGLWSGQSPFHPSDHTDPINPMVAVITRATIKTSKLIRFWRYVPTAQKPVEKAEGLIYTKGIGEAPIKQMATFSLWTTEVEMKKFAYQSSEHQQAIKMTRALSWYKEELFARFQPYAFDGNWEKLSTDYPEIKNNIPV